MAPITSTSGARASVSGLASGLDTAALVDSLMQIERRPLQHLQSSRAGVAQKQGLMRQLNTLLLELRDAGKGIDNRSFGGSSASTDEELVAYSTSSSAEGVVTATAGNGATPGDLEVTVRQLATQGRQFSGVYTPTQASSALAAGQSVTIDFPNADPTDPAAPASFTVTASSTLSLDDLKDEINRAADNGGSVHAEVVREGNGDQIRLALTAGETGVSNEIAVSGALVMDGTRTQAAQDAIFTVFGGGQVTRPSNFVDDAVGGLSFDLQSVSEPVDPTDVNPDDPVTGHGRKPTTVTVAVDVDAVAEKLDRLVNAYNAVMDFIDQQVKVDGASKRAGPLSNDSTLRGVQTQLSRLISDGFAFSAAPGNPFTGTQGGSAAAVGLEVTKTGRLEIDEDALTKALEKNTDALRELISGRDPAGEGGGSQVNQNAVHGIRWDSTSTGPPDFEAGLATALVHYLEPVVRSGDGLMATRDAGYASRLDGMDDSIARFEAKLSSREETLKARFTQMELLVSNLQSQAGFLSKLR